MPVVIQHEYQFGDLRIAYQAAADAAGVWGLVLWPDAHSSKRCRPREALDSPAILNLPKPWSESRAWAIEPLVHVHVTGDHHAGGYLLGRSLRSSATTEGLRVKSHSQSQRDGKVVIETTLVAVNGLIIRHELSPTAGGVEVRTTAENLTEGVLTLDFLSSFSLGGITPFAVADEPDRIRVHRFRSEWSAEGRHESRTAEELNLERSWTGHGTRVERFGQVGSLPVNGWFPTVALEDVVAGVVWLAQLAAPGTWQMEVSRSADTFALSGGGADRLAGEWRRSLQPGETFAAPLAFLTAVSGTIDDACDRLVEWQRTRAQARPPSEHDLPIIFNEWCSSWGHPGHASLLPLAARLENSGVRYLVIDDGWAERPGEAFQQNGDWIVNRRAFPDGFKATADAIRARGLVPGLWFEFEVVNPGSAAWHETSHQLQRDGVPLQVGLRRFWDFRDPWVHEFLSIRVIGLLREAGLGYLKVDYNDTIGPGVDGPESPGENLRRHLDGVQDFFRRLRVELPDLVIENCSSGGHRLEPSMLALTAMSSFSDAHETPDVPLIAANLNRLVWSAQKQIWAVLRARDSRDRLSYSLAATFLGRMCLSGDVQELGPVEWDFVQSAMALYREVAPVIRDGKFRRQGNSGKSYQHPSGEQIVTVLSPDENDLLVVWHRFAGGTDELKLELPGEKAWQVHRELSSFPSGRAVQAGQLRWTTHLAWTGGVMWLRTMGSS